MIATLVALAFAAQSPCDGRGMPDGPVVAPLQQADFGVVRRACPRSEVALGGGGRAVIEEADFYADLRGNARLDVSAQVFDALELSLAFEPVFYEQVIQSFRASHTGVGDLSAAATLLLFTGEHYALSAMTRATFPTSVGYYANAWPFGFDAGPLLLIAPMPDVRLHAGALLLGSVAATAADADPRAGIAALMGATFVFFDWLAVVTDLQAQALLRAPLDRVAFGLGLRAQLGDLGAELGTAIPLAGADRHLGALALRLSLRL